MKADKPRSLIVYPYLLAVYPILYLWSHNTAEVPAADLVIPIAISVGAVLLLQVLVGLAVKDRQKAALIVSLAVIFYLSRGHVSRALYVYVPWGYHFTAQPRFLTLWIALAAVLVTAVVRTRSSLHGLTRFLNLASAALVAMPLAGIVAYQVSEDGSMRTARRWDRFVAARCARQAMLHPEPGQPPRDVYYIILDEYGRADRLKQVFGYDNRSLTRYLARKGFYVADKSVSNYSTTYPSLSCSLNMDYLDVIASREGAKSVGYYSQFGSMIRNNTVARMLKNAGYRFVFVSSGWQVTDRNPYADVLRRPSAMNEFDRVLLSDTALVELEPAILNSYRHHTKYSFEQLAEIPKMRQPSFALVHIVCPHRPFVFDSDGNLPDRPSGVSEADYYRASYPAQVEYVNKKVCEAVERILAGSDVPPIIIIQGDHGFQSDNPTNLTGMSQSREILNAYYLPDGGNKLLYPSISPVNSFRVVFNRYFGGSYKLLKDQTYELRLSKSKHVTEFRRLDD